ncbi:unnamed protein product [Anisakis simplex]|uniref:G_PROTEIN_RECEP_F1_2 domain-containing protein n=1 Tax=Anisakis simplex TaxID=6269 RepID=A0A0M3KFI8_ANISI|nr:unnamed protein product [Anisakis simplex]
MDSSTASYISVTGDVTSDNGLMNNDMTTENAMEHEYDECEVPHDLDRRWYLVAVAGTSLSFISLFSNLLIAKTLLSKRRSHFFFLGLLACSDCFLSFCYGPVIAMDIIKNRVQVSSTQCFFRLLFCFPNQISYLSNAT